MEHKAVLSPLTVQTEFHYHQMKLYWAVVLLPPDNEWWHPVRPAPSCSQVLPSFEELKLAKAEGLATAHKQLIDRALAKGVNIDCISEPTHIRKWCSSH
ncbi:hypothetical protein E2C01_036579 [Portunus trituberculatus]|uniref:Uncharacterized protein n=1 Tax=Portunus trituberculatus TaxID=210409 RepID=A0A5B7FCC2_PORTR|nr:hypothetical protein [Portunus trituberculatus]